jgi:hypothetical protein
MTERVPLGEKEDLHREFKSRDALKKPEIIAREVVAMLNAEGGTVWVGLRDENDRAVAVEPIADADRERRRLRDYLVDTIEPSPAGGEVEVEGVSVEGEGEVLRVQVRREVGRAPYAHLKESGRLFLVRISDRTRPMTREELMSAFQHSTGREERLQIRAAERLLEQRGKVAKKKDETFWLGFEPVSRVDIDIQDPKYVDYLMSPSETGNRPMGWSFRIILPPALEPDALVTNPVESRFVEIRRDGGLSFRIPLEDLHWTGGRKEFGAYALSEFPVSAFRIARKVYEDKLRPEDQILVDMAFFGIHGWKLRPGSPDQWGPREPREFTESRDLIWERPLAFSFKELDAEPDRCGYRFIQRIYEAFGFGREAIPKEFDRQTGRLILPE